MALALAPKPSETVDMSDLPDPWATWAARVGARPSRTGIGERAGVPASTISRLIQGRTTPATVEAVAAALRVSAREVLLAATGDDGLGPWVPPLESHLLDAHEREALNLLIQRLASKRGGTADGRAPEADTRSPITKLPSAREAADAKRQRMLNQGMPATKASYEEHQDDPTMDDEEGDAQ